MILFSFTQLLYSQIKRLRTKVGQIMLKNVNWLVQIHVILRFWINYCMRAKNDVEMCERGQSVTQRENSGKVIEIKVPIRQVRGITSGEADQLVSTKRFWKSKMGNLKRVDKSHFSSVTMNHIQCLSGNKNDLSNMLIFWVGKKNSKCGKIKGIILRSNFERIL